MANYEFIEEFDTSSDEEDIRAISASANDSTQAFLQSQWNPHLQSCSAPFTRTLNPAGHPQQLYSEEYNNFMIHPNCDSTFDNRQLQLPFNISIPPSKSAPIKRKRKRKRKQIRLSEFDQCIKAHAWNIWKEKYLKEKMEKDNMNLEEREKITQELIQIQTAISTYSNSTTSEQHENRLCIHDLVNKIKYQRQKRMREKIQRSKKCLEKKTKEALTQKRISEIEEWLEEAKRIHDKQRKHELFVQVAKKSLFEVTKKKQLLLERVKLLTAIEKLRSVRRKQLINVRSGFDADSTKQFDQKMYSGMSDLNIQLKNVLKQVEKEEEMICNMIHEDIGGNEEKASGSGKKSHSKPLSGELTDPEIDTDADLYKLKRSKKWQKYLYKKMHREIIASQHQHKHY